MLYIENLLEFVRLMIVNEESGTFFPQNAEYGNTSEIVKKIGVAHGRKVRLVKGFGWALKLLRSLTGIVDKAFGSLCYDFELSRYHKEYCVKNLQESILETER